MKNKLTEIILNNLGLKILAIFLALILWLLARLDIGARIVAP